MTTFAANLEEANFYQRALLLGLYDGVVMQNQHGVIQTCNASAERILGLTPEQMMGLSAVSPGWRAIDLDGEPFPEEERPWALALHTGQPVRNVVAGIYKPDGSLTWVLVNATPLFNVGEGTPHAIVATFADITARIGDGIALGQAHERLERAIERAELAMATGRVGIWDWDIVQDRLSWDACMYRLYGLEPSGETVAYDLWSRHLHAADREAAEQAMIAALEQSRPYDTEYRVIWPDGSEHHLRATGRVTHDASGRALRMIGTNWDVTLERRLARDLTAQLKRQAETEKAHVAAGVAARAAEDGRTAEATERQVETADRAAARFRALMDAAPDTMVVVGRDGTIGLTNHRAVGMFGYAQQEFIGQPIEMLIPARLSRRHQDHVAEYFVAPTSRTMGSNLPMFGRRKDGSEFPVEVSVSPFKFDGEEGVITAIRDVTDRKRLETSLESSRHQITLSARLSALGTMAGGIAHEINNPLAIISAIADNLRDLAEAGEATSAKVLHAADRMLAGTDRIGKIVRSLRYLARDGSRDPWDKASVKDVVSRTLDLTIERFRQNSVELRVAPIDPELWLDCREVNVSQILLNLLQNAFDAAFEGTAEKWVRLEVEAGEEEVTFSVIDSGQGVPPEIRTRIMEPFFTTKPVGKGTGLGLSLSKQMALEHGGRLDLAEVDGCTCFSLHLPRTQESPIS